MIAKVANHTVWNAHEKDIAIKHKKLAEYGSCAFSVHVDYDRHAVVAKDDVKNIIDKVVTKFGKDGRIGAKGEMACWATVKEEKVINGVDWNIHHV